MALELRRLGRLQVSLAEATEIANAVTQGKAGFQLQVCQVIDTQTDHWDASLNLSLKSKCGMSLSATSAAVFHSPAPFGLGMFSFGGLATAACGTELLHRLNSPGLLGDVLGPAGPRQSNPFRATNLRS